jgi:hypothetical protein
MKRIVTLTALIMSGLVGTIVGGQAAAGTEPQVVTFRDQGFFAVPDLNCKGFKLLYTLSDELVIEITYFDEAGEVVRVVDNFVVSGVFTNSETGEMFRDHAAGHGELDLTTGVLSVAQLTFIYHRKGDGLVFLDAGRRIFDADGNLVFSAGPDDFEQSGIDGICEALG